MYKGLMLTNALPSAEKELAMFAYGVETLRKYDINHIEFYTKDETLVRKYGKIVKDNGYTSSFHGALDLKRSGWCRLCSEDEIIRQKSVEFSKWSIEKAISAGSVKAIIQSGRYPDESKYEAKCWDALAESLETLSSFAGEDIQIEIEPCDRSIEVCQLIGPAMATYTFMRNLNKKNVLLAMDTAHIALAFEDAIEAIKLCKPYSEHVHLTNCVVNPEADLYGDKHPMFGYPNGVFSDEQAQAIYKDILDLYGDETLYVAPEMICRDSDEKAYLDKLLASMPWFFEKV